MRIMTFHAGLDRIMHRRIDLRKSGRSRCVVCMTQNAESAFSRLCQYVGFRVLFRMHNPGTVTYFTGEVFMIGTVLLLVDIFMALRTCLLAGIGNRERLD